MTLLCEPYTRLYLVKRWPFADLMPEKPARKGSYLCQRKREQGFLGVAGGLFHMLEHHMDFEEGREMFQGGYTF